MCLRTLASVIILGSCLLTARVSTAQPAATTCACENVEQRKLHMEWWKLGGTVFSLFVPLGIAALTLRRTARANLELKATEIVLNSRSPSVAKARAGVLAKIFPDELSRLDAGEALKDMPGYAYEQRLEVFKAMIANPNQEKRIAEQWIKIVGNQHIQLADELAQAYSLKNPWTKEKT